jgi:hypothetical protein
MQQRCTILYARHSRRLHHEAQEPNAQVQQRAPQRKETCAQDAAACALHGLHAVKAAGGWMGDTGEGSKREHM